MCLQKEIENSLEALFSLNLFTHGNILLLHRLSHSISLCQTTVSKIVTDGDGCILSLLLFNVNSAEVFVRAFKALLYRNRRQNN